MGVLVLTVCHVAVARRARRARSRPVLPPAVASVIRKTFPGAKVRKVERERRSIIVYEVEMRRGRKEMEVEVTRGGRIIAVENSVSKGDLPKAVMDAIVAEARGGRIKEIEKVETRSVLGLLKLKKPKVVFEAEILRNGREMEIEVDSRGKVLRRAQEEDDDDEDDDDEDDDDDDDDDGEDDDD